MLSNKRLFPPRKEWKNTSILSVGIPPKQINNQPLKECEKKNKKYLLKTFSHIHGLLFPEYREMIF